MRRYGVSIVLMLLVAVPAWAQTTGSITGTVTDNTGAILPGVTVTATSPALMGTQTSVTNENGQYRFPSLPPGEYKLKYQLTGFGAVNREGIIVGIGFNAAVNVQLAVANVSETITVSGESPVVDTKNTNIQTNVTQEMLNSIPNARDIWTVIGQSPGMMVSNFDVGGSRAGTQTGFSAFGFSDQVRIQVDGVNTTEGTGGAGFYYDYGSFAEIQLGTDGNDAQAATPGVQLNAIIKSGGNKLKGNFHYDYENENLQSKNITPELQQKGAGEGTRILLYRDPNFDIGGPIKRDKFWYYGSIRDQRTGTTVSGFPVEAPSNFFFETRLTNWTYKLNYQLSPNNKIGHYIQYGRKFQPSRGASASNYLDSRQRQDSWSWALNVDWNSVVSDKFFFTTRYANFGYDWPDYAYNTVGEFEGDPTSRLHAPFTSTLTGIRQRMTDTPYGNTAGGFNPRETNRDRNQFDWTGTYFKDSFVGGDHALKFGVVSEWESLENIDFGFLDNVSLTFNSDQGRPEFSVPQRVTIRNTPRRAVNSSWHHGAFLNDQLSFGHGLTANIGVRWDYYSSYYPNQSIWDGPYRDFFYGGAPLPNGFSIPATTFAGSFAIPSAGGFQQFSSVAPRVGLAWDITGKGRTVAKVNWGRFYQNTGTASDAVNPNQSITYQFNWSDLDGDRQFDLLLPDGRTELGTFRSSSGGTTQLIDPNIKHPYTDSTSVWLEHELFPDIGVRVGYTFRKDHNISDAVELQRLGSLYTSQVTAPDPGVDGTVGNSDDGPAIVVYDIPTGVTIPASRTETRTVPSEFQIDRAVDLTVTRRLSHKWSVLVNYLYNWDHDRGLVQNPNQERFNERTITAWAFRVVGSYHAPYGFVVSPVLRHQAGDALSRNVSVTSGIDENGVQRDVRVGTITYQAEGPSSYREDNITIVDMRVEKRFTLNGRMSGHVLGLFFDGYNLTNSNASQSADSTVGRRNVTVDGVVYNYQRFLRPTGLLPARVFRFGINYNF
jgi:hypothetical protein